ncbi:MAG: DUF1444 family protein [Planctomycetes bacterium]|nr:DUF1444 family protein [Planctomycetota bacterium]
MWLWLVLGWCATSVVVAAVHHRIRSVQGAMPAEVEEFLLRLETTLAQRHPEVEYLGLLPGQFTCVLRVNGQETPVALQDAYRHSLAFPDEIATLVDRMVTDIQEVGLDRVGDHDLAGVATHVLPQIRTRGWLDQRGCFGDSGLVHRAINQELVVVYVIDDPQCMVFVCRAHLRNWRLGEADLHNLAIANLHRLGTAGLEQASRAGGPMLLDSGDGYDAARVLLLEQGVDGLLVAMPDRDVLWVGQERGQDLASLMATTEAIARDAAHPVSPHLFRVKAGQLEVVERT